jgi:hypothetical protein
VCLDGSLPAYHLHRGSGDGARGWLLQFEGGGWCIDVTSCAERAGTRRGSTRLMTKREVFSGILSNNPAMNPGTVLLIPVSIRAQKTKLHTCTCVEVSIIRSRRRRRREVSINRSCFDVNSKP